jgi:C1A family cysteine protease
LAKVPSPSEPLIGGHSVCLVGYDDAKQTFKFINSWGPTWGDHGYGYLPFKYLEGSGSESWAITM